MSGGASAVVVEDFECGCIRGLRALAAKANQRGFFIAPDARAGQFEAHDDTEGHGHHPHIFKVRLRTVDRCNDVGARPLDKQALDFVVLYGLWGRRLGRCCCCYDSGGKKGRSERARKIHGRQIRSILLCVSSDCSFSPLPAARDCCATASGLGRIGGAPRGACSGNAPRFSFRAVHESRRVSAQAGPERGRSAVVPRNLPVGLRPGAALASGLFSGVCA